LPSQPSTSRGTLILLAPNAKDANISTNNIYFVFQYNPEKLFHTFNQESTSTLAPNTYTDPQVIPAEFFNLTFELDSTDTDPSAQNQSSANLGIHPALAMLELMMQPQAVNNQTTFPIVVFVWGAKRTVAVRFISMSIEEKSFDFSLNPTRATVNVSMRVLDAAETNNNPGAHNVCLNNQNVRATLVDAYKLQTGQINPMVSGQSSNNWSSVAGASGIQKPKVSA
jgi:hypothetical protein